MLLPHIFKRGRQNTYPFSLDLGESNLLTPFVQRKHKYKLSSLAGGSYETAPKMAQLKEQSSAIPPDISALSKCLTDKAEFKLYFGTEKFADLIVNLLNGKMIKCGKNMLLT